MVLEDVDTLGVRYNFGYTVTLLLHISSFSLRPSAESAMMESLWHLMTELLPVH